MWFLLERLRAMEACVVKIAARKFHFGDFLENFSCCFLIDIQCQNVKSFAFHNFYQITSLYFLGRDGNYRLRKHHLYQQ